MVGDQFTDEQHNFIFAKKISLNKPYGGYALLCAAFEERFPGVNPPSDQTVRNIVRKQNAHYTVKNLNSKASPGPSHSGRLR